MKAAAPSRVARARGPSTLVERRETVREKPQTIDGKTVEGGSLNQGFDDLQLRIGDQARAPASRGLRFHTFH